MRENDVFLMDTFIGQFSVSELKRFNCCRMYLQAMTLSDITTGDGNYISDEAWNGNLDPSRISQYSWPVTGDPYHEDWSLWKKALRLLCSAQKTLQQPLGDWLDHAKEVPGTSHGEFIVE